MKRVSVSLLALPLIAACSGPPPVEAPAPTVDTPGEVTADEVMWNTEMHLWLKNAAPSQGQKPLLSIRAKRFMGSADAGNEWSFEGAEAVAPAQDDTGTTISFEAERGTFVEDKRADLQGGVKAHLKDMTIALEDITWEIGTGEDGHAPGGRAYSHHPLKIDSPTQKLEASSMTLDPETAQLLLNEVSGEIYFGENDQ